MRQFVKIVISIVVGLSSVVVGLSSVVANTCDVSLSTSLYINWVAIDAAQNAGLYNDIERQYGCKLSLNHQPDYLQSLAMASTAAVDAVTVTNLDQMLALSGRNMTAIVLQDYSAGNDGIILRNGSSLNDIKGQDVYMVRASISEQLFIEKAKSMGLDPQKDFNLIHVDADSVLLSGYLAGKYDNIVTWNPALDTAYSSEGNMAGTSAEFPKTIIDMIALGTDVDDFDHKAKFLRALWDKTASVILSGRGDEYNSLMLEIMNKTGNSLGEVKTMLGGSKIFTPDEEMAFYQGDFPKFQEDTYKLAKDYGFFSEFKSKAAYELHGNKGGDMSAPVTVKFDVE